jgi:hypothetical protein
MGILARRMEFWGDKNGSEEEALFDSGASFPFVREDVAERLATLLPLREPLSFETARQSQPVTATHVVRLEFRLNGHRLSDEFMVLEGLTEPAVIGAATMQKFRMKLDFEQETIAVDPSLSRLRII